MKEISILICTLPDRKEVFEQLCRNIYKQAWDCKRPTDIEILTDNTPRGTITTGAKRNLLLSKAKGKYVVFIDDDDEVPEYYITELLRAAKSNCDCFAINGRMTTDGRSEMFWKIYLGADYILKDGIYHRFPNHITPIKREFAQMVKFDDITIGEDYKWACKLRDLNVLKSQYVINKPMYHYKYKTNK